MAGAARPGRDQSRMSRQGRPIYLDYQATTPLAPEALRAMRPYLEELFGNPHSPPLYGREAAAGGGTAGAPDATAPPDRQRGVVGTSGAESVTICGISVLK